MDGPEDSESIETLLFVEHFTKASRAFKFLPVAVNYSGTILFLDDVGG